MSNSESKSDQESNSAPEVEDGPDSQYDPDDTDEEIPDPNNDKNSLFQDRNHLPVALTKLHFKEGFVYLFTLKIDKEVTFLGFLIETMRNSFRFRVYHTKGKARKTFHTGSADKELDNLSLETFTSKGIHVEKGSKHSPSWTNHKV